MGALGQWSPLVPTHREEARAFHEPVRTLFKCSSFCFRILLGENQRFVRIKPAVPFLTPSFPYFSHWKRKAVLNLHGGNGQGQECYFRLRAVGRARTRGNRKEVTQVW